MAAGRVSSGTDNYIEYAAIDTGYVTGRTADWGTAERPVRREQPYGNATQRKRARSRSLSRGFVAFLTLVSVAALIMCIQFLRLKSEYTTVQDQNEIMMSELTRLRAQNDALYENIDNSLSLEVIKDTAVNKFGMNYAEKNQIIWYNADDSGYIRQYGEIPD